MTAWFAIVMPICLMAKCAIDLMGLEYGSKYQPITDEQFVFCCIFWCGLSLLVDFANMLRYFKDNYIKINIPRK